MRNLHRRFTCLLLLIIFFIPTYTFGQPAIENLNADNIKRHIEVFTSPEYSGRLIGTEGNEKTLNYIENYFSSIGLQSFRQGSYRNEFQAVTFHWHGIPKFNIVDGRGQIIDSYEEGKDFIFRFDNMSLGGKFQGGLFNITEAKEVIEPEDQLKDKAALINYKDSSISKLNLNEEQVDDRLHYIGKTNLIIYEESNLIENRGINLGTKNTLLPIKGIMKIGVNPETYQKLMDYMHHGYEVDIDIPISFTEVESSNLYGFIPGKNYPHGNYIMVATSIDGLGVNWDGKHYPGASDNGASIGLMLELARVISSKEEMRDTTILFVGFNGKHTGFVGLQEYLRKPIVMSEKTEVIYLDKVSGKEEDAIKIATFLSQRSKNLTAKKVLNQFAYIGNQLHMNFELDSELAVGEYALFRNYGIIASNLTYGSNENINRILDDVNNINTAKIQEVAHLVHEYIEFYGDHNLWMDLRDLLQDTWLIFVIGIGLLALKFSNKRSIKESKVGKWVRSRPILSVYLIGSFFIIVLMIQTKQHLILETGQLLQDITVDLQSLFHMLTLNTFTTLPMMLYLLMAIASVILCMSLLYFFGRKMKQPMYLFLMSIVTYVIFMMGFKYFYDDQYTIIYPKLLSFHRAEYIVILFILLYSILVTWIFTKETQKTNNLKIMMVFLVTFFIFISFTYSPYVLSKEIIDLKATGSRLKL